MYIKNEKHRRVIQEEYRVLKMEVFMNSISNKKGLTANALKIIAIIAMTLDHIAAKFISPDILIYQLFRAIGRLTIVIMCYMVVEGYHHTRDIKKYLVRMFLFAIISHVPFVFMNTGRVSLFFGKGNFQTSVMWPLFLGLVTLCIWNSNKVTYLQKVIFLVLICLLAIPGDWNMLAVIWIWGFDLYYEDKKMKMKFFGSVALAMALSITILYIVNDIQQWYKEIFHFGLLAAIPVLSRYNGKPGRAKSMKWFFYIYYPLHMVILGLLAYKL